MGRQWTLKKDIVTPSPSVDVRLRDLHDKFQCSCSLASETQQGPSSQHSCIILTSGIALTRIWALRGQPNRSLSSVSVEAVQPRHCAVVASLQRESSFPETGFHLQEQQTNRRNSLTLAVSEADTPRTIRALSAAHGQALPTVGFLTSSGVPV